jgi:WD40-like Beta Propeller Repeat
VRTNQWGTGSYAGLGTDSSALSASSPVLSADGRFVAFKTSRGQIVRYDTQQPTNAVFQWFPPLVTPQPPTGTWFSNAFVFYENPRVGPISDALAESTLAVSRDGRWLSCLSSNAGGTVTILRQIDFETLLDAARLIPPPGGSQASYYFLTNRSAVAEAISTNLTLPGNTNLYAAPASSHAVSADGQRFIFIAPTALPGSGSNVLRESSGIWLRDMATNVCVLLSTNRAGLAGPDLSGIMPALSPDGALVAWDSPDPNLVEDDLNQAWDVFAREVASGETRLVSARHTGLPEQTGRASSWLTPGAVSGDGRRVALLTYDSSLDANDTNRWTDAIVRDLAAGTNFNLGTPLQASSFGTPITNTTFYSTSSVVSAQLSVSGESALFTRGYQNVAELFWHDFLTGSNRHVFSALVHGYSMSPSGRYVAYATLSGSYVQIVIRTVSRSQDPWLAGEFSQTTTLGNNPSINPVLSDGLSLTGFTYWVAFQSQARNFTADVVPGFPVYELFVFSSRPPNGTPQFRLVSYLTSASPAPGGSSVNTAFAGGASNSVFSADGRHLFFEQTGVNVIYRHRLLDQDILTLTTIGTTVLTNRARPTNDIVCTACANPSVSADGRFAAYESRGAATNIYVRDLQSGAAELVSVNAVGGAPGNGRSFTPLISWDARYVVFASKASDLVSDDTNRATDVFVRDRLLGVTHCLSRHPITGRPGSRASSNPVISADGRGVAFQSFADDLAPGDYNETRDVFVVRLGGGDGDGDGMDDDWEVGWFSTTARDGSGDFDGDGASDLAEFRAGTNPADGASVLRVLTLTTGGNPSQVTLLWSASPGRRYRVQHLPQIGDAWSDVTGDLTAAGTSAYAVVTAPGSEAGFYRVLLVE